MGKSDVSALDAAAERWVGTPWCDNSATVGKGACCHRLMAAIYQESGWLPAFDVPDGSATAARWLNTSPILDWFRGPGHAWFDEVLGNPIPGDALLIRTKHVPHHLVLVLSGQRFVHVTHDHGVQIAPLNPVWRRLLAHTFRPRAV